MPSRAVNAIVNPHIDTIINPFVPHNQVRHFPKPLSHFLGYREKPAKEPALLIQWLITFLATVAGICVVGAMYNYAPLFVAWKSPTLVASLGASAILDYNTIRSPLAQPRNAIVGHVIAAIVGTGISKAFQNAPHFFANHEWVAAAVACALSSVAMSATNSVHPPGGATAILACTEASIVAIGWKLPAIMLFATLAMTGVALLFNNIFRQYPVYWWTPEEVGQKIPHPFQKRRNEVEDEEKGEDLKRVDSSQEAASERTLWHGIGNDLRLEENDLDELLVLPHTIKIPLDLKLNEEELEVLQSLQARLGQKEI